MDPRTDRRFRRALLVGVPVWMIVAPIAVFYDWSLGGIYLAVAIVVGSMVMYTHYDPRRRSRRRR